MRENYRNSIASIEKFPQFTTMNVIDGQAGLIIYASLIFYSLTVDNILNIIVLLILAGISVTTITSNNGILTRAKEAKEQTVIGQEKESVELAYITAAMKKLGDNVTSEELQHELDLSVGANKTQVAGQDILQVLFTETEHSYEVENGTVTRTEIFDANDGFYIGEGEEKDKVSLKLYVPKKDAIVSDIILKGFVPTSI